MLDAEELTSAYIFGECAIAQAAVASPEAQWKLANLKKMKR